MLRSLIRILRASLAQINTEMDEKYAKLAEKFIRQTRQGCKVPLRIYTISEKGIRFRHLDYDPDRAQKLTSSSMSRHLSTRKISSKSMHAFLSNLANRQTDRQTPANSAIAFTSSFLRGKVRYVGLHRARATAELSASRNARLYCVNPNSTDLNSVDYEI